MEITLPDAGDFMAHCDANIISLGVENWLNAQGMSNHKQRELPKAH